MCNDNDNDYQEYGIWKGNTIEMMVNCLLLRTMCYDKYKNKYKHKYKYKCTSTSTREIVVNCLLLRRWRQFVLIPTVNHFRDASHLLIKP